MSESRQSRGLKFRRGTAASTCLVLALLAGCGGGGMGSSTSTPASCGASSCAAAMMTMTDAQGDFTSYVVKLTSLKLQTAAGAAVETLPVSSTVDFTQLVNLTEIISARQIPAAEYVSATLTLDYSNANITADDGMGNAVPLSPVDSTGAAITGAVTVSVQLDNRNHLVITPGRTGRLAFDFNLAASNTVNLTAGTVTVSPTLVATVVPSDNKQVRVRGQLASASASANDFVLNVQPFFDTAMTGGDVTVNVSPTTAYQINGTAYVGMAGITALAALPANTLVAAFGTFDKSSQNLVAAVVLAGSSLQSPERDQVSGTVIARSGTTLTVRGARCWLRDGSFEFDRHDVTVNIGSNTGVTEEGMTGTFGIADISVGQHIDAFGTLSSNAGSADPASSGGDESRTLDATAGEVRLELTPAWGMVSTLGTGSLTLNLQSLDGLPASVFDFSGTGAMGSDAAASAYVVTTGSLSQSGLSMNAPARVFGFVTPYGSAPPDFTAQTLVNYSSVTEALVVDWAQRGSTSPFTGLTAASTSLQLDLTGVDTRHFVQIGPERLDLTTLASAATIAPDGAATDTFTIGHRGKLKTENYSKFADFVAALAAELNGSSTVVDLVAAGTYDSTTNTFTASAMALLMND